MRVGLTYVLLFYQKKLSSEKAKKCPNVLCGIMNSENMSNHFSTKNCGKFQRKLRLADVMTFFLVFTCLGQKNGHLLT